VKIQWVSNWFSVVMNGLVRGQAASEPGGPSTHGVSDSRPEPISDQISNKIGNSISYLISYLIS
jgi:hypothetical protein